MAKIMKDDSILADSMQHAIPEFRQYNIAESEVQNVV